MRRACLVGLRLFYSSIFLAAFLCPPFLPSVSDCKQSIRQNKGQVSVRFPVEIQNDDENVSQRLSNTGHNNTEVMYTYFFIIIFLF